MAPLEFSKYEGLGNDFIVVEVSSLEALGAAEAVQLCDRHRGVGADGVLLVGPPATPGASASMRVLNADGSRPEMCGNGVRCVALHLADKLGLVSTSIRVDTDAGVRACRVEVQRQGCALVTVGMGPGAPGDELSTLDGSRQIRFASVSMGNPHAVLFGGEYSLADIDRLGAQLSSEVPGGTNVEFAQVLSPTQIQLVVWERGVGRTEACGTGACATSVAAALAGLAPFGTPIEVILPGGPLQIAVAAGSLQVEMCGPARRVFTGQTELSQAAAAGER